MLRAHKIRIFPSEEQEILLRKSCGVARFSYNWALGKWKEKYENKEKVNEGLLRKELNSIKRKEFPWMLEVMKRKQVEMSDMFFDWVTDAGRKTLSKGYMLEGESQKDMYRRIANASATRLKRPELTEIFYELMCKNWLCPATPVASNMGTTRALPISCYGNSFGDSISEIYTGIHEFAMLTKSGGGVGTSWDRVRSKGTPIAGGANGRSEGIIPWLKVLDSAVLATNQGQVRSGAASANLSVWHKDFPEFLRMRRPVGDNNRLCLNLHHCAVIDDKFMSMVADGDKWARSLWAEILQTRVETGEPYIMFKDTVNRGSPECYKKNNLDVNMTNICAEISLHQDLSHTFVCCLSSLNLARWDEWKDSDLIYWSVWFLDGVMQEFIDRSEGVPGLDSARRFALKSRALGLGVLGWHTLLQRKNLPFDSFDSMMLNAQIFKRIKEEAERATIDLAKEYGEPEWCEGHNRRNTHLTAIAPTFSNSIISGDVSAGIEPLPGAAYNHKTAKGTFTRFNPVFLELARSKGKDDGKMWRHIVQNRGSVQDLDWLTDHEKEVFRTAKEINQMALIRQAAQRQKWIDQSQSLNLFFPSNADSKEINLVHLEAWKQGVKTLYYVRSESVLKGDSSSKSAEEVKKSLEDLQSCSSCEG